MPAATLVTLTCCTLRKDANMTKQQNNSDDAAALKNGQKPGPKDAPQQVRDAGTEGMANPPKKWDDVDEAVDESFPASDSSAKY